MGKNGEEFYGEFGSDRVKNSPFPHFSPSVPPPHQTWRAIQFAIAQCKCRCAIKTSRFGRFGKKPWSFGNLKFEMGERISTNSDDRLIVTYRMAIVNSDPSAQISNGSHLQRLCGCPLQSIVFAQNGNMAPMATETMKWRQWRYKGAIGD